MFEKPISYNSVRESIPKNLTSITFNSKDYWNELYITTRMTTSIKAKL